MNQGRFELPLPRDMQPLVGRDATPQDGDNLGLWLDKFVRRCRDDRKQENDWALKADARVEELERLFCPVRLGTPRPWRSAATAEALARLEHSCKEVYDNRWVSLVFNVRGRLLVDYGRSSAVETSLSFHHLLGCPRIPGSALKGALRQRLREALGDDPRRLADLLGAPDAALEDTDERLRGRLVIHDALPVDGVFKLAVDVLTPHARDYYEGKTTKDGVPIPPADWISPIPHTFLTVVETRFRILFGLLPKPRPEGDDTHDLDLVTQSLEDVLWTEGIGAKRSAGYGRLVRQT